MENSDKYFKGVLAIVIASFLWGTTGTVASYSPSIGSLAIGAFSMGAGGLFLVLIARKKLLVDYELILKQPKVLFIGAISVAIYPLAFYTSMSLSGVAIGTVVSIASAPFFAVILECLISKKNVSLQWILSFIIGAVGITFLILGKEHSTNTINDTYQQSLGILLGCIAGLAYAIYSWAARCFIECGVHSQSSMSVLFGCAALLLLPSLWFTGDNLFSNATNILVSLYMAIIPMFLGYLLFSFGLNYVDASKATLITLIEPVIATILAVMFIGESFKTIGWFGVTLVFLCMLMQTFKPIQYQELSSEII